MSISLAGPHRRVADVFDVITSARSYKEPGSAVAARDEIARCAGVQFDPRVVRAFLSISLGRLRLAMGPLSWLAQAPLLGRIPLTPGIAAAAGSAVAVVGSLAAGLVGGQSVPTTFAATAQAAAGAGPAVPARCRAGRPPPPSGSGDRGGERTAVRVAQPARPLRARDRGPADGTGAMRCAPIPRPLPTRRRPPIRRAAVDPRPRRPPLPASRLRRRSPAIPPRRLRRRRSPRRRPSPRAPTRR